MSVNINGRDVVCPHCAETERFQITQMDSRGGRVICLGCGKSFQFDAG
ncbi:hypothetical protein [Nonomuraea lactucae]|nr:hypothetical protein [Nonomuraea lactucae]